MSQISITRNALTVCAPPCNSQNWIQPIKINVMVSLSSSLIPTYLLTYLLTTWSRVLPEKLTGFQLVKKFPAFYGTLRFITAFTSARHLSLSRTRLIQSIPPHPTSWRSILILSSHLHLGLPSGLFPSGFHTKRLYALLLSLYVLHARPSHSSRLDLSNNIWWTVQISFLHSTVSFQTLLFVPEMSASFTSYIVCTIYIALAWILYPLQFSLLPLI